MNVSKLTDTELNRAMIWLYPKIALDLVDKYMGGDWYGVFCSDHIHLDHGEGYSELFPLKKWDLILPLAVESGLDLALISGRASYGMSITNNYISSHNKENPLRAICEVLVMIKLSK